MYNRAIILDFDGTLADTQPLIVNTMQRTIGALHLPSRTDAECQAMIGLPLKECFTTLLPIDDAMGERCAELYRRIFDEENHPGVVTLFPHVLETLAALHNRGQQLAICSSRGRPTLDGFVKTFHLEEYIGVIVSANDVQHAKPNPEPVLKILSTLDIKPSEAIVVGDTTFDILMGRDAGCRTCGVTYGNQSADALRSAGATYIIDDFAELAIITD